MRGKRQSHPNLSSFLPLISIISLFYSPHSNEKRTTAHSLPKELPASIIIFMHNKIDIIIINGKVHENYQNDQQREYEHFDLFAISLH